MALATGMPQCCALLQPYITFERGLIRPGPTKASFRFFSDNHKKTKIRKVFEKIEKKGDQIRAWRMTGTDV